MRIAVISDVHGNLIALEAVLRDLRTQGADLVVNLGDCVTAPLWPKETNDLLVTLAWPTVRGNHDRWLAELPRARMSPSIAATANALRPWDITRLGSLPTSLSFEGDSILAVHGTPRNDAEYLLAEDVDGRLALATPALISERLGETRASLVVCGHSHHQHLAQVGETLFLNPGSVGCPRYVDHQMPVSTAEAGSQRAHYAVLTRRDARWSAQMLAIAYDTTSVAARARSQGRGDWALAFSQQSEA